MRPVQRLFGGVRPDSRSDRLPQGTAQSRASERHLADRAGAGFSTPGTRRRAGAAALEVPAGTAQARADHQFPLRGTALSERPVFDPGVPFVRVHRREGTEIEMEIHQDGPRLVLLCRPLASDARRRRERVHNSDHRTGAECCADPQSSGGGTRTRRLAGLGLILPGPNRSCFARSPPDT